MQEYKQLLSTISKPQASQESYTAFLKHLNQNIESISSTQTSNPQKSILFQFLKSSFSHPPKPFFPFYHKLLQTLYTKKSNLIQITYQTIPHLLIKSIQSDYKLQGLEDCLVTIYNNQFSNYNQVGARRGEMISSHSMQQLYQKHMNKQMNAKEWSYVQRIQGITISNRSAVKSLLFWLWYSQIGGASDYSVLEYFNTIYIYCGGNQKEIVRGVSLYLLEKKNTLSFFKYSISEQEMEWIILALYDLAIQRQNFKYQLLAAINMVHKKAANQCQFRLSQIAQSVIHLLEDQYVDVF